MNPTGKRTDGKGRYRRPNARPFAVIQPVESTLRLAIDPDYMRKKVTLQVVRSDGHRIGTVSLTPGAVEELRGKLAEAVGELAWAEETTA